MTITTNIHNNYPQHVYFLRGGYCEDEVICSEEHWESQGGKVDPNDWEEWEFYSYEEENDKTVYVREHDYIGTNEYAHVEHVGGGYYRLIKWWEKRGNKR